MTYRFLTVRAFAVGEDLLEAWDDLADRVPDARYHQRPAWVSALDRLRPEARISLHAAFVDRCLVAVVPAALAHAPLDGLPCRVARVPSPDASHFTDPLVAPEHRTPAFIEAWLAHLASHGAWDVVHLSRVPDGGAVLQALEGASVTVGRRPGTASRFVDVSTPERLGRLSARAMRDLDRLTRRARREVGPLRRLTFADADSILEGFRQFVTVEASGWKGSWDTLSALAHWPRLRAFYAAALSGLAPAGAARVDVLYAGENPLAAHLAFRGGDTWYLLRIGYDEVYHRIGPGGLLLRDVLLEMAATDGIARVDLVTAPAWSDRWHMDEARSWELRLFGTPGREPRFAAGRRAGDGGGAVRAQGSPRRVS